MRPKKGKKAQFSPIDNSATPALRLERATAKLGLPSSHKPTHFHFDDIDDSDDEIVRKRRKHVVNASQAETLLQMNSIFSPEGLRLNGSAFSDSNEATPAKKKIPLKKAEVINTDAPVKRGRGRPKGSKSKPKSVQNVDSKPTNLASEAPVKRKRGRPSKAELAARMQNLSLGANSGTMSTSRPLQATNQDLERPNVSMPISPALPEDEQRASTLHLHGRKRKLKLLNSLTSHLVDAPSSQERSSRYQKRVNSLEHPQDEASHDKPRASRRTSYSERGKRLLSIGNGFESQINPQVSESDYNKWFDEDLLDPDKMKQLLIWCFRKKLHTESSEKDQYKKEIHGVSKLIEAEILHSLLDEKLSVDWNEISHDTLDDVPLVGKRIVKPNPTNESNKESIEVFSQKLRQLEDEEAQWLRAYKSALKPIEALNIGGDQVEENAFRAHLHEKEGDHDWVKNVADLEINKQMASALLTVEKCIDEDLSDNTDKLFHLLHKLKQGVALTTELEKDRLSTKVNQLARCFGNRTSRGMGAKDISVRDLLRGISRIDSSVGKVH